VQEIEDRLRNWARAMRVHPHRFHCRSLEGQYRSPQRNHWSEPVTSFHIPINMHDAWVIELACATLNIKQRIILRSHYCFRAHPHAVQRMVRRDAHKRLGAFNDELLTAQHAINHALTNSHEQNQTTVRLLARIMLDNRAGIW